MCRTGCILLLLLPLSLRAQDTHWEFSLGAEYMLTAYSFHSIHNTWGTGFQAARYHRVSGGDYWIRRRHNPSWGIKFDLGLTPQSICGNRLGVAGMLRTPLLPWLDADMGLGLATFGKPNFRTGNLDNVYISTPVVCLIDMGLIARLDNRAHLALRLLHSSNGNMRRPNRGLNYFRLEMGIPLLSSGQQTATTRWNPVLPPLPPLFLPYHELGIALIPSLTISRHSMQHGVFFCYDVALNYEYHATPILGVGATVDLWYNYSHPWQLPRYHDPYTLPMYFSAMAFLEGFWGPVSLKGGIGGVIAASSRVLVPVYERLAVYYNFGNNYAGIGINAHMGQAEYIEWTYGRRFPIGKRRTYAAH